jgi:hypothetical protein
MTVEESRDESLVESVMRRLDLDAIDHHPHAVEARCDT